MSVLDAPYFNDPEAARQHLEAIRWPDYVICPHCGCVGNITKLKSKRAGLWKCNDCTKQFTVTVGTVFERSKIPLHTWFKAVYFLCSSKKGMSSHQMHRTLGVTYKTAWFMTHRIREAMRDGTLAPLGGKGKHVEVDETFIGTKRARRVRIDPETGKKKIERGAAHKHVVITLVERGGKSRSIHAADLKRDSVYSAVLKNIDRESRLQTDEATHYRRMKDFFEGGHGTVHHSIDQYVKGEDHTQTVEGYFSIFKRGMKGVYQHCGEQHLHRYLAEFDFRYNHRTALGLSDWERTEAALKGIEGKRLTYGGSAQV